MKQIKTIKNRLDNAASFDEEVNAAIAEGWRLTKREVLQPKAQSESLHSYTVLYAELEREEIAEELHSCENCSYFRCRSQQEPCRSCEIVCNIPSKWAPAT